MASFPGQEPTDVTTYVNWARAGLTPFDLALDFGFRTDDAPPSGFPVRVVMSWEHAKELVSLLRDAIEEYEEEVGEIRDLGGESVGEGSLSEDAQVNEDSHDE